MVQIDGSNRDGVGMGCPLGPTLVNIFMSVLETKLMANCPSEFKPILNCRYIDDTFFNHIKFKSYKAYVNFLWLQ